MRLQVGNFVPQFYNFNDKSYELIDPIPFLKGLFTYPTYPTNHVDLVTICLIGSMGSGKSTTIDYITEVLYRIYGDELHAFRTTDLVYALKHGVELGFVQLVIFDDAMKAGFDSRRSMSSENINMSENFALGRHLVEEKIKRGILFVIFAIQSPTRLDKFIRENTDLTLYKTYYQNLEKDLPPDECDFVKDFTEESMLKHNFEARSSALGITRTGKTVHFYFPKTKPSIEVPFIHPQKLDLIPLQQGLMENFDLANISNNVLKGYVMDFCEQKQCQFTNKEVMETIYRGSYEQFKIALIRKKEAEEKAKEQESKITEFEPDAVKVLTERFDLENEDKGVVKGYFISYCRDHKIDYSKLDYNAIFHLALYQQKKEMAMKQITDPDQLSLEILKFKELLANDILGIPNRKIAEIQNITEKGVLYRKKLQKNQLKQLQARMKRNQKSSASD